MALETNPIASELLARLTTSADVHVQKFDLVREAALLIALDANAYRAASFLDDRILNPTVKGAWVPLAGVVNAANGVQRQRPLHFIYHTGHVGSTLVSRLLDESGAVLSLREPLTLRQLAEAHDSLGGAHSLLSESRFDELLATFVTLWGRGYDNTKAVIVKATSSAGRIASSVLRQRPETRAIYLNLRAEPYLATLLAGQNSPADLRGHAAERAKRLHAFGTDLAPVHRLSLGELAAMSWLAETWSQDETISQMGERVIAVDFDTFLSDVAGGMRRLLGHFGLPQDEQFLSDVARNPTLTRYAKAPEHAYTPALRAQILAQSRHQNADELTKGLRWLQEVARGNTRAAQIVTARG